MEQSSSSINIEREEEEQENLTDKDLPLCFTKERHLSVIEGTKFVPQLWRLKERMKTVSVALVLCLNVGVDPPDVIKTQPCARLECWIDLLSMSPTKALEKVGSNLRAQYENWQPRARYKQSLDPTAEEVKKLCLSLRKTAKEERVLFHYNGHGVPKPTTNGEIWVFNRQYTQYIPLSIFDLQTWMGSPSIYVYDCSNAGIILESFKQFAIQHETEYELNLQTLGSSPPTLPPPSFHNCIQLGACASDQVLPMNPDLPADLFTACLTTPIKVALRWFVLQRSSNLVPNVTLEEIDSIPGTQSDRRTMKGELNWIFTAITDTIAWNTLPMELFQRLFRQDLLVASLFRNYLLAERIMRACDCTPVSSPELPPTHQHPLWEAWDLALDLCLAQLPEVLSNKQPFKHLPFFEQQLSAFQVWLDIGETVGSEEKSPPEQLPIVLQVLLSQIHRMRALELLGRFLNLGPWAVNLALSVGIFPYVLKLLQSSASELRAPLLFIWSKILAIDKTCQSDLVRDGGHKYFLQILQDNLLSSEVRTQAVFCLSCIVNNFQEGKELAVQGSLISICLVQLNDPYQHLRQWLAICLGLLWDHYESARWTGVRDNAHEKLYDLLRDPSPEVRASAVFALGTFINASVDRSTHAKNIDHTVALNLINTVGSDMSCLVRKELINALQWIVLPFETGFTQLVLGEQTRGSLQDVASTSGMRRIGSRDRLRTGDDSAERMQRVSSSSSIQSLLNTSLGHSGTLPPTALMGFGSMYSKIWLALGYLELDPSPEVSSMCSKITSYIRNQANELIASRERNENFSMSLPPSPNRGNYMRDSPPNVDANPIEGPKYASRTLPSVRSRRYQHSTISENTEDRTISKPTRLVSTQLVEWASKYFVEGSKNDDICDRVSRIYHEREWRFIRNKKIREEAKEEQERAPRCKLESQLFNTRMPVPPSVLKFHPYDQQIAVAGENTFSILDWGTGAKNTCYHNKSLRSSRNKITALEWVNGHDISLLMIGVNDGSIKVFKPNIESGREPRLITAWQAFNEMKIGNSDLLLNWEQWSQTVITAGDSRVLRFWDAEKETKAFDIVTGTDSPVRCLSSCFSNTSNAHYASFIATNRDDPPRDNGYEYPCRGYVATGFENGSVRLFDRRCPPADNRVKDWMEHSKPVLGVQLLNDNFVMSASSSGHVKLYDIRKNFSLDTQLLQEGISCFSVHNKAAIYACGGENHSLYIYNLRGRLINDIRFFDGFMAPRIGLINCLNFHPHKVVLASGTADSLLSVHALEGKR